LKKTESFFTIRVVRHPQGLDGVTFGLKGDVYLGSKGKLCGSGNECVFATEQEALDRIERFEPKAKNRNAYEFEILKGVSTIGFKGSVFTPKNYFISIPQIPEQRLIKQPSLRILFERDGCSFGGKNIPVKHKNARWFEVRAEAEAYVENLSKNPRFEGFIFEVRENPDSKK